MNQLVSYREYIKNSKCKSQARKELKEKISSLSLTPLQASKMLRCSRNTIYKLMSSDCLDFESKRTPLSSPLKLSLDIELAIVEYHKQTGYGPDMIRLNSNFKYSTSTIYRVLKSHNLVSERPKRYKGRRYVSKLKKKLKAFEKWQLDTKYLTDIENLVGPIYQGTVPKYEYTLRDMVTGTTFLGFCSKERGLDQTCVFTALCLYHMQQHGIDTHYVTIQSDNGPENLGNIYQKREYELEKVINAFGARFKTIPIRSPRFNSHVETFHGRIEKELYDRMKIRDKDDFLKQSKQFQLDWNTKRKTLGTRRTPERLAKERGINLSKCFYDFPILVYDRIQTTSSKSVQYVSDEVNS